MNAHGAGSRSVDTVSDDLEQRAWLLARTATRVELARRVIALAEEIEHLHELAAGRAMQRPKEPPVTPSVPPTREELFTDG